MRRYCWLFLILFFGKCLSAQTLGVKWQKAFGGTNLEEGNLLAQSSDSGYVMIVNNISGDGDFGSLGIGATMVKINKSGYLEWKKHVGFFTTLRSVKISASGDIYILGETSSSNHGGSDVAMERFNSSGNLIWGKSYGGSANESAYSFAIDQDGTLLIGAETGSNNGDVSGNHGLADAWLLKVDENGTILWSKCFGGSSSDVKNQVLVKILSDGYYFLTETQSTNGDVTSNNGNWDIWLVKLSTSGTLQWQKTYGGTDIEGSFDFAPNNSGGYYILGSTLSATMPNFHTATINSTDIYVVKIASDGSLLWQKCFGSSEGETLAGIFPEDDGGVSVIANVGRSGGDVIGYHNNGDAWWFKTDASGIITAQRCVGGSQADGARMAIEEKYDRQGNLLPLNEQAFIILGTTRSNNNGDISGYHDDFSGTFPTDLWLFKLKKNGSIAWLRCLGGTSEDFEPLALIKTGPTEYVLGGSTQSSNGDVVGQHGIQDGWILKFGPANLIKGTVYWDANGNNQRDFGERLMSDVRVKSEKVNDTKIALTNSIGFFKNDADTGNYITTVTPPHFFTSSFSRQSNFSQFNLSDSFGIPITAIPGHFDLKVSLIPLKPALTGTIQRYLLMCTNVGTETINNPVVRCIKDNRVGWVNATPAANSLVADTATWQFSSLAPFDTIRIQLDLNFPRPPALSLGDTVSTVARVDYVGTDETPIDNLAYLKQLIVGSYDPNDKSESHAGKISLDEVQSGAGYLFYVIRFQNTGTASARAVVVRDTLDANVDASSFEMLGSSHTYQINITDNNKIEWSFPNINLPDSNSNEPASHGYVYFKVRALSNLQVNDVIHNKASIYFDFNAPVQTNDAATIVFNKTTALPIQLINFTGQLNNNTVQLSWQTAYETDFKNFAVERSVDGVFFTKIESIAFNNSVHDYKATDNISASQSNHIFYRLKLVDKDGKFSYSKVIAFYINSPNRFVVYPNPARTEMFISMTADKKSIVQIIIIDASGRTVAEQQKTIEKGSNVFPVNTSKLKNGNYILEVINVGETRSNKFTIAN